MLLQSDFVIFFIVDALELQRVVQRNAGLDANDLAAYARLKRVQIHAVIRSRANCHPRAWRGS